METDNGNIGYSLHTKRALKANLTKKANPDIFRSFWCPCNILSNKPFHELQLRVFHPFSLQSCWYLHCWSQIWPLALSLCHLCLCSYLKNPHLTKQTLQLLKHSHKDHTGNQLQSQKPWQSPALQNQTQNRTQTSWHASAKEQALKVTIFWQITKKLQHYFLAQSWDQLLDFHWEVCAWQNTTLQDSTTKSNIPEIIKPLAFPKVLAILFHFFFHIM